MTRCLGMIAIGTATLLVSGTAGEAQTPAQCAAAYHAALEPTRAGRGVALGGVHRAMRTPDQELSGKWLFAAQVFAKGRPAPPPKAERVCVEQKEVRGKQICARFELKQPPPPPREIALKLPQTPDELRILRVLNDFVEAKGAVPDVGANGRYSGLIQRVAQDLRLYVNQPAHPALCAGSKEITEFYTGQLATLKKRIDEVTIAAKQATELAAVRVRNIAVAELKVYDKVVADAAASAIAAEKAAAELAAKSSTDAATTLQPAAASSNPTISQPLPLKPVGPAQLGDYAVVSFAALVAESLRPLLPQPLVVEITGSATPLAILFKARAAVLDPDNPVDKVPAETREAALMALRLLEARYHGERYVARFAELNASLFGVLDDVKAAQSTSCICKE